MAARKWKKTKVENNQRKNLIMDLKSHSHSKVLDECIKNAEESGKETGTEILKLNKKRNSSFFGAVKDLMASKPTANRDLVSGGMSVMLSFFLKSISLLIFAFIVVFIILVFLFLKAFPPPFLDLLSIISSVAGIAFIFFCIGVMTYAAAQEIIYEKDRNYIADVFSGITGFIALVIALIALFHDLASKG